jgi:hypothetical protein
MCSGCNDNSASQFLATPVFDELQMDATSSIEALSDECDKARLKLRLQIVDTGS